MQVAANPYVTALGDPAKASSRLTLTQAFNSLGTTIAPTLGGMLILSGAALSTGDVAKLAAPAQAAYRAAEAATVQMPYLGLAALLLVLAGMFAMVRMPRISHTDDGLASAGESSLLAHRHLLLGTVGIFLYVGGK
jgi:FHS family L-fucose permease-like MFS transporter